MMIKGFKDLCWELISSAEFDFGKDIEPTKSA